VYLQPHRGAAGYHHPLSMNIVYTLARPNVRTSSYFRMFHLYNVNPNVMATTYSPNRFFFFFFFFFFLYIQELGMQCNACIRKVYSSIYIIWSLFLISLRLQINHRHEHEEPEHLFVRASHSSCALRGKCTIKLQLW